MLQPIRQNDGATDRERYLARLARGQFFNLWSYPGLSIPAKHGIAKELVDLTVIFGDDVILFSDKDIAWPQHSDPKVAWSRWYRASVKESAKQLWGAEKHIRQDPKKVFLDTKFEEPFPFLLASERTRYHLIAVTANSVEPARRHFDAIGPGSSGTMMLSYGIPPDEFTEHLFVVGDLDPNRTFVHVFDEETLNRLLFELGTVSDFIHYLTEKAEAIRDGFLRHADGEEEILGFYLQEETPYGFGSLAHFKRQADVTGHIPEGEWRAYCASAAYRVHANRRQLAANWAALLREFDTGIVAANTGEANHVPVYVHELTLRIPASENQASRARLATAFVEKYAAVPPQMRSSRIVASTCAPGRFYVFVFVPWIRDDSNYDEYRAYRLELLRTYATVLPIKIEGVLEAVFIGAQTNDPRGGGSETMVYAIYDEPLSEDEIKVATELMTCYEILDSVTSLPLDASRPMPQSGRRYGRNDPCPCGLGRKNKKCCNITGPRQSSVFSALVG